MHALFLSNTRMYELTWRDGAGPDLPVEAWWGREALSAGFELCIDLLATDAHLELKHFFLESLNLLVLVFSCRVIINQGKRPFAKDCS